MEWTQPTGALPSDPMASWRPLSRRDDPTYDEALEGLPDHLFAPAWSWAETVLRAGARSPSHALLEIIQLRLRLDPPLRWTDGVYSARDSLRSSMVVDPEIALDVLDLLLLGADRGQADALRRTLGSGGSIWTVGERDDGMAELQRRAPAPIGAAMDAIQSESDRAHHCLRIAWGAVMGRQPNSSTAYRESVRAVEIACRPVVSPDNARATLGSMIGDMKDKPEKWRVGLTRRPRGRSFR